MNRGDLAGRRIDCDVAVVGAGAAGVAAALAAARQGARVCLLEKGRDIGGTVVHSLIHTVGGLHDAEGRLLNPGLPSELAERLQRASPLACPRRIGRTWTLSVEPDAYRRVIGDWLREEAGVRIMLRSGVEAVRERGGRIVGLRAGAREIVPGSVIDATGSAEVARRLDPALVEDGHGAAAGHIFRLRGVAPGAMRFPESVQVLGGIRQAAAAGALPPLCAQAWLDVGVAEDEVYVKLALPLGERWREPPVRAAAMRRAQIARDRLLEFLRRQPAFAAARLDRAGSLGIRDGGRVVGEYRLSAEDVRAGARFDDAAARCAWPIEFWDPASGVSLEYLPPGRHYEIPLRALKVRGVANLWAAGKNLCAEPLAQASARVAGCCWAMGEAAGRAAAAWEKGTT
jgi:hypothetical protein